MSGDTFDVQGEVRDALNTAVNSYGKRVLSDPRVLGNLVTDLLPDNPRERSLLVTAAEAGIAGELTQNVEGQHMDADTAVAIAAQSLTDNRSLDRGASMWVATEYAKALGYQVQSQALPAPTDSAPPQAPGHDPTMLANQPVNPWAPTPAAAPWGQGPTSTPDPAPNPWGQGPTSAPASPVPSPWGPTSAPSPQANQDPNAWAPTSTSNPAVNAGWAPTANSNPSPNPWAQNPSSNPPGGPSNPAAPSDPWASPSPAPPNPWAPNQQAPNQGQSNPWAPAPPAPPGGQGAWPAAAPQQPRSSRRGLFLGGGAAAAILVVYVAIAAVAQVFPFAKSSNPTPSPSPSITTPVASPSSPVTSPVATPTAPTPGGSSPVGGSAPTGTLAAGVKPLKVLMPYDISDANTECNDHTSPWTNPGLVRGIECTAPDMPNGQIIGYQLDSTADYLKSWANYNKWANFGTSKTLDCPPSGGNSQGGPTKWWGPRFPKMAGQVIECFTSDDGPVYVWTYPTEDTFIIAQPPKSWAFSKLETWWENNAV